MSRLSRRSHRGPLRPLGLIAAPAQDRLRRGRAQGTDRFQPLIRPKPSRWRATGRLGNRPRGIRGGLRGGSGNAVASLCGGHRRCCGVACRRQKGPLSTACEVLQQRIHKESQHVFRPDPLRHNGIQRNQRKQPSLSQRPPRLALHLGGIRGEGRSPGSIRGGTDGGCGHRMAAIPPACRASISALRSISPGSVGFFVSCCSAVGLGDF